MRVTWDDVRPYSQGISKGVLYPQNSPGVAWNGLTSVTEKGDDSPSSSYIDGLKFRNRSDSSSFAGTISAFTYPDEFGPYIGVASGITTQPRSSFGLCYRDNKEIHLVYNARAALSGNQFSTLSDQGDLTKFSWDFTTVPVKIPGGKPTSHLVIMVDYAQAGSISALEALLYGTATSDPALPDPATVIDIFESNAVVRITDNGDGTWTASGPDSIIVVRDGGGWSYLASGTSAAANYAIVTTAQAANIKVNDYLRIFHLGVRKENTQFQVTSKSDPFAGFVNVFFTPNAQTGVTGTDTITQAANGFDIDWSSAVYLDANTYEISSL